MKLLATVAPHADSPKSPSTHLMYWRPKAIGITYLSTDSNKTEKETTSVLQVMIKSVIYGLKLRRSDTKSLDYTGTILKETQWSVHVTCNRWVSFRREFEPKTKASVSPLTRKHTLIAPVLVGSKSGFEMNLNKHIYLFHNRA